MAVPYDYPNFDPMLDYDLTKKKGYKHYRHKFLNRTQGHYSNYSKYNIGNSIHLIHYDPTTKINSRIFNKKVNFNIVQHTEIDTIPILSTKSEKTIQYNKSTIQTIVPYRKKEKINKQINTHPLAIKYRIQSNMIKICNLAHIDKRLWLGNINLFTLVWDLSLSSHYQFIKMYNINHVINFSDDVTTINSVNLISSYYQIKISHTHIEFPDSLHISYDKFKNILFSAINKINSIPKNENILLICNAGINRSVSIAIGYAMICKHMSFKDALTCVEIDKSNDQWYNLTNLRLMRILRDCMHNVSDYSDTFDLSDVNKESDNIIFEKTN